MCTQYITQFALVAMDWSHGKAVWANEHPMSSEQMMLNEANRIKAARPSTNIMIYRNTVKALSWFDHVREKLLDPAYSGWFLSYG
jgi:hypothetical protein